MPFKVLAVAFPVCALLSVTQVILDMPPFVIAQNVNFFQWILVLPYYLGVVAAPGYLFAVLVDPEGSSMTKARQFWVRASLCAAIIASIGGLSTALAILPLPFVLGCIGFSVVVRRDFNSSFMGQRSQSAFNKEKDGSHRSE